MLYGLGLGNYGLGVGLDGSALRLGFGFEG